MALIGTIARCQHYKSGRKCMAANVARTCTYFVALLSTEKTTIHIIIQL